MRFFTCVNLIVSCLCIMALYPEREFENKRMAFHRFLLHLNFLVYCRDFELVPNFIKIKKKTFSVHQQKIIEHAERQLLHDAIKSVRKKLCFLNLQLKRLNFQVMNKLNPVLLAQLKLRIENKIKRQDSIIKNRHFKKLDVLFHSKNSFKNNFKNREKLNDAIPFINLSSKKLNCLQTNLLLKGPKYIFPTKFPGFQLITDIENFCQNLPPLEAQNIRACTYSQLKNKEFIPSSFKKIAYELKHDENINILMADKSKQIVILNKGEFNDKVNNVLSELKVRELSKDPTNSLIRKLALVKKLKFLPEILAKACYPPLYPAPPLMFFKIKIHKELKPLRPLVSKFKSPLINLETAFYHFLKPFFPPSPYSLKSSLHLIKDLKNIEFSSSDTLYSFDVVALFPSVPLKLVLEIITEELSKHFTVQEVNDIISAFNLIIHNNYFVINGRILIQDDGCPMGSRLSGFLADLVMTALERKIFASVNLLPKFYRRYVDDTIIVWSYSAEQLEYLFNEFNLFHPSLKFTKEQMTNNKLNFLDITFTLKNGKLLYEVYHKKTDFMIPIPAAAYAPFQYKKSFFLAHFRRAFLLSSNYSLTLKEIKKIFSTGLRAGYSYNFLNKILSQVKTKLFNYYKPTNNTNNNVRYNSITYHPKIERLIKKTANKYNIKVAFRNRNNLFQTIKTDRDKSIPTGGVYKIPLINPNTNEEHFYIGKTARNLNIRVNEHKYDIKTNTPHTELSRAVLHDSFNPLWQNAEVLYAPRTKQALNLVESLEILKNQHAKNNIINEKISQDVSTLWVNLLK